MFTIQIAVWGVLHVQTRSHMQAYYFKDVCGKPA